MTSSESSSSDLSSSSSESTVVENLPAATMSNMSFAVQRSESEVKLINKAVSSLLNTFERYRPHLTDTDYAYFCRYGTDYLNGEMHKKARKLKKNGMENSMMSMVDSSCDVGSLRSGCVPLYQFYPSNATQNMRFAGAPSVVSSIANYPRQPDFQRYMQPGHSSGYSSGVPSFDSTIRAVVGIPNPQTRRQPPATHYSTLHQAIEEVENRQGRPELPTPSTSSGGGDNTGERAKDNKRSKTVPKQGKGVIALFDWALKLIGQELYITGTNRDKSQITSGPILRYSNPIIITSKGSFRVASEPCFEENTPDFVRTACSKGFPRTWKALLKEWSESRQGKRKSTPKKTSERKNKNNSASDRKIKSSSSTSKAANSSSKKKESESARGKNVGILPQNKATSKKQKSQPLPSDDENESIDSPVAAKQAKTKVVKSRSNPDVSLKKKKWADTKDDENESIDSPVAAKQAKTKVVKSRSNPDVSLKKKKRADTTADEDESVDSPVAAKQAKTKVVKIRSNPDVSKKKKQPNTTDDEDESVDSPVAAKQAKTKVVKSRSNPDVSLKKKKQPDTADNGVESVDSSVAAKQAKTKVVKSRSHPDVRVSLKKKKQPDTTDDESESESDGTEVSPIQPAKRAVQQDLGSDTSWDTSKKRVSPAPKAPTKKFTKNKDTKGSREPKPNAKGDSGAKTKETKGSREPKSSAKGDAGAKMKGSGVVPKQPTTTKPKQTSNSNKRKDDGGSKKPVNIFGDEANEQACATDAFSAMGGDDLFSIPYSRSMTPNTFVASIKPDAGTIGRYTPPLQNLIFSGNSQKTNSTFGSPSSLNNSRDNLVSKRVAKDVEATKRGGKKGQKLPRAEGPDELDDIVKSLKNPSNSVKTPTIVKKIFRNQRDHDDDESNQSSDQDESMVY